LFEAEDLEPDTDKFPMNFTGLDFNFYAIYLFAYSTLKFKSPHPNTYVFPDFFNSVPSVIEVNEKYMEKELKQYISHSRTR
jgi:hypothetical protein